MAVKGRRQKGRTTSNLSEWKATAARFEQRINEAQLANPPTKEKVKRAIKRTGTGRCPSWAKRLSMDVVVKYGDDLADLFCEYPDDLVRIAPYELWVGHQPADRNDKVDPVYILTQDAEWTDEWGTRWAHSAGGTGAHQMRCPIEDWSQLDEYIANQLPKADAPGRFDAVLAEMEMHRGSKYLLGRIGLLLYERLNCTPRRAERPDRPVHQRDGAAQAVRRHRRVRPRDDPALGEAGRRRALPHGRLGHAERAHDLTRDVAQDLQALLRPHDRRGPPPRAWT